MVGLCAEVEGFELEDADAAASRFEEDTLSVGAGDPERDLVDDSSFSLFVRNNCSN